MEATIAKHPIHPMLVVFPIGLWIFSLVCDLVFLFGPANPLWRNMAFYTMAGGWIGALAAAVPGLIDYFSMSPGAAKRTATTHMTLNLDRRRALCRQSVDALGRRWSSRLDNWACRWLRCCCWPPPAGSAAS